MTPIAHTAVGIGGWLAGTRKPVAGGLLAFVLAANLPDADFLLRLIPACKRSLPHQVVTHNLFFALLSVLLFLPLIRDLRERWLLLAVAFSHPLLDLFVVDTVPPIGFPLLWPLSRRLFHVGGFPPLLRGDLNTLLSPANLVTLLLEIVVFVGPLWLLAGKRLRGLAGNPDFWRWR